MKTFGEKLKELIEINHITQEDLGKKLNPIVSQPLIQYWLKKEEPPKKKYVKQLAKILMVPEEYFYRDNQFSSYQDLIYFKKLIEINDYKALSELIVNNAEFQKMYDIPKELIDLFKDVDFVESVRIIGEELRMILTASYRFRHRFTKKSYMELIEEIKELLSKRPSLFKK